MIPGLTIEKTRTSLDFINSLLMNDVYETFNNKNELKKYLDSRINQICKQFIFEFINPLNCTKKICGELGSYLREYFRFLISAADTYSHYDNYPSEEKRLRKYVLGYNIKKIDYLILEDKFELHLKLNIDTAFGPIYIEYPHELSIEDYIKQLEPNINRKVNKVIEQIIKEYYDKRK
jgi:hypothetical protein